MAQLPAAAEVGRLINLIPVGLKEAAIDSPTARATMQHYGDQVDLLDKWLDDYLKSTNRLIAESVTLENILNSLTSHAVLPTTISETMLDHDYSVLAMKKYSEGAKDFWMSMVTVVKRLTPIVCEPIRQFQANEIKPFKEARRTVEQAQKIYDNLQSKYMALGRFREPSSVREDAFQLHEARRSYLHAEMEFFALAPQFRFALDRLLVRIFHDQWDMLRQSRDSSAVSLEKGAVEMGRVRGWIREMENSERSFKRELATARKELEDAAELSMRPARDLDAYSTSIATTSHAHDVSGATLPKSPSKGTGRNAEKQGWLFLRTYTGKPTRTFWVKRWAFVRNGVFGWLVQDIRLAGVEESERIGVLLCNVRPAVSEERRFCLELKTNRNTIVLQAETQGELNAWIRAFEAAKTKALDNPNMSDGLRGPNQQNSDPAFSISPPPIAEFGTNILASTEMGAGEESATIERINTLPVPGTDTSKESVDLLRKQTTVDDGYRDHASRIMSKLDLHRKAPPSPHMQPSAVPIPSGGIASLIAASHGSMPVGPSIPIINTHHEDLIPRKSNFTLALRDMPASSLAPSTLANTPAPTSLSKAAVAVSGERGLRGVYAGKNGIPNGILANIWGSSNAVFVNRFDRTELRVVSEGRMGGQASPMFSPPGSPTKLPSIPQEASDLSSLSAIDLTLPPAINRSRTPSPSKRHRNTISFDTSASQQFRSELGLQELPSYYPLQLKTQDAQFRLLFPNVKRDERLVMVFRATWNPNDQQDFPGRAYVTTKEMYFYSNHLGLILTSGVALSSIEEVTAAPGKDCDFLFMHLREGSSRAGTSRITIKTFLEPLKLLQYRLNYLVTNSVAEEPAGLEGIIKTLLKMEADGPRRSPSMESWEDVSLNTPVDGGSRYRTRATTFGTDFKGPIRVDRALGGNASGELVSKFKLPAQPVKYTPPGYKNLVVEREYDVSPKALFHVMFGDKSALWQLLQHERQARELKQGPWISMGEGRLFRDFEFQIPTVNVFGQPTVSAVRDYQVIDVNNDHLCYVVTDKRTPWHLPFQKDYRLVSKIVITHAAKSKCKLAVFIKVEWQRDPWLLKAAVERHALEDLDLDAQDLRDLVSDQVRKLGAYSRTKKAIQIFGQVGQSTDITQLQIDKTALHIEMRRVPVKKTVYGLLLRSAASALESVIGTIFEVSMNLAKWLKRTISANTFILVLLASSALYNGWLVTQGSFAWRRDRDTANFMKRLGITPNHVMSKAVYVSDLDQAMSTTGVLPTRESSYCYSVFYDDHYLDDIDAPLQELGTSTNSEAVSIKSRKRVQSTRQRLGSYRHNLLVAMRVVNNIEQEVIQSEWERWLTDENRRCRQVETLLASQARNSKGRDKTSSNETRLDSSVFENRAELETWYNDYCMSCKNEYKRIGGVVK